MGMLSAERVRAEYTRLDSKLEVGLEKKSKRERNNNIEYNKLCLKQNVKIKVFNRFFYLMKQSLHPVGFEN
eukprot:snap_masked-scaffold_13-processed-gene-3.49-mRNA-1 protein AED:1.00 eAED:1.00 QI:0/-1/0/0/-1/1/1/0/70